MYFRKRADPIKLPPPPYVVSPSGSFDGNDGKWSTFVINVGDGDGTGHGQNFKVLISTSSSTTLVPGTTGWCTTGECLTDRGILTFNEQQPRGLEEEGLKWQSSGLYAIPLPKWWTNDLSANTTENMTGDWGEGNLGLGMSSTKSDVSQAQWVVSYTFQEFFLGSLGLAVGKTGPPGKEQKPNFLDYFHGSAELTPSLSYGYTAGAYYRNNGSSGVLGNLVLGGYDKSRMTAQGTPIRMPSDTDNALDVGVASIVYVPYQPVEANKFSLATTTKVFSATIDSTLPYLILPDDICDQFELRFRLQYEPESKLYTVNATAHDWNLQQNATVRFKIVDGPNDSTVFTSIHLPYAAFIQNASFPTYNTPRQYFPIKKSSKGAYVLGRTFLQEAYIVVDYERINFTVAPAYFSDPMPTESLVSIYNQSYTGIPHPGSSDSGLPAGAIAGIVVGIVLAFILAGIGAFFWWKKRDRKKKSELEQHEKSTDIDTVTAGNEILYHRVSELGSETAAGYYNDHKKIHPISELSPESPPVELYSPGSESASDRDSQSYFAPGGVQRRGARRRSRASSGLNTPGTPIAELPGDDGGHMAAAQHVDGVSRPTHSRGPSDTSLSTNIDEVLAGRQHAAWEANTQESHSAARSGEAATSEDPTQSQAEANTEAAEQGDQQHSTLGRRPSHGRGLSDSTIHSDSTAVSQPTPEELERWARSVDEGPHRPLSQ